MRWPAVLLDPAAYPGEVDRVELRETHASWIALAGPYAYKVKRPIALPFIDYSTLERRRTACEVELALNRRWAPSLYLDLQAAVAVRDAVRFVPAAECAAGAALEYAVRMRRFPAGTELDALLAAGAVTADELAALGRAVAGWQADAPRVESGAPFGEPAALLQAALQNFDVPLGDDAAADALRAWTRERFAGLEARFAARRAAGCVRECHGDLHARNVVRLADGLVPFDGIDFAPHLRWIDVATDVAFLAMDLERFERRDLAHAFLDAWLEATGDHGAPVLLRWLIAYRALVRAKIDALRAAELGSGTSGDAARREVATYLDVARAQAGARVGTLYATTGPSGSGKSRLSAALAVALPALRLRSDVERKRLAGLDPLASSASAPDAGLYAPERTACLYAHLAGTATAWLAAGWDVIVDAAALHRAQRAVLAGAASRAGAAHVWLECTAPDDVLRRRVAERRGDPSEATTAVLERQLARAEALDPAERARAVTVDTAGAFEVAAVAAALRSAAAPPGACSPSSAPGS